VGVVEKEVFYVTGCIPFSTNLNWVGEGLRGSAGEGVVVVVRHGVRIVRRRGHAIPAIPLLGGIGIRVQPGGETLA
jgi:hypothetical protein